MDKQVLIAYATATGSTLEVTTAIAETLESVGFVVDVKSIDDKPIVRDDYQAVIIGSAVQYGTWLPEAVDFVKHNQQTLSRMPVILFCVHIQNQGNDPASRHKRHAYLDAVRPYVNPIEEAFFMGRFNREGGAIMFPKWVSRFVPTTDLRNWNRIRTWARNLAPKLQQRTLQDAQHD